MSFSPSLPTTRREELRADPYPAAGLGPEELEVVTRDGIEINVAGVIELLTAAASNQPDPIAADALLAPWVHSCLRLTRAEAANDNLWEWLAVVPCRAYVIWRWADDDGGVAANRWRGQINKQAIARLWWGAELLRDGDDYAPVRRFFALQDFPNSYLHRRFMRSRPMALGLMDAMDKAQNGKEGLKAKQVNAVARVVNLCTRGVSLPRLTAGYHSDGRSYRAWLAEAPPQPGPDLTPLPTGPADGGVPTEIRKSVATEAARMCARAGL